MFEWNLTGKTENKFEIILYPSCLKIKLVDASIRTILELRQM